MAPQIRSARPRGPHAAKRPYQPALDIADPPHEQRVEEALDHIAFVLSAMDHNLEALIEKVGIAANALHKLTLPAQK
jgi:hypothetical protein